MCGIAGEICARGSAHDPNPEAVARMRDRLAHRGPDDAGLWSDARAALGHRRLSVIDPTPAGHQPLSTPDGRFTLVYNGELYNDAELRRALESDGCQFRTACDTETVLLALATWGTAALTRFRGMYALALWDAAERRCLLARDPLGIKPLHYIRTDGRLLFASEIPALFEHPSAEPAPDWPVISSYLTSIRTTLGDRTMFDGVRTLRPGEALLCDASGDGLAVEPLDWWSDRPRASDAKLRDAIEESVRLHLRADVPTCSLLSGGIDSTVVAAVAMGELGALDTYCAGAVSPGSAEDDFAFAGRAARSIGSRHHEARVDGALFVERWQELVAHNGVPMSTPNEVAINEVARALRADGKVVTLSGEGADELLGGYELPMSNAAAHVAQTEAHADRDGGGGRYQYLANAWTAPNLKHVILHDTPLAATEGDQLALAVCGQEFDGLAAQAEAECADEPEPKRRLQAHLRYQRRVNLEGLLRRLDTSTMHASVEGRTPLADHVVAALCERLPMQQKFLPAEDGRAARTKIALREAAAGLVPPEILSRPKASFPLPFEGWIGEMSSAFDGAFARSVFKEAAIARVSADPAALWHLAWPMLNVAMWGRHWWG